ncbi:hypothetical protein ATCC90586_008173 [Pythium insidiosum]|nr:hypothetical protein ATCC90586_008173 [Pythium insidiosum]
MHHAVQPSATAAASVEEIKTFRRASATSSALTTTTRLHVYCSNSLYVVWKLMTSCGGGRLATSDLEGEVYYTQCVYFEVLFLTREFVETGLQSYQAYQMTHQSPRLTLNRIFVALLVINCWSSSLVHLIVRDRALQRLLCILSDTILDFVATIGVPVVLAVSYLRDFDWTVLDWKFEKYYEDKCPTGCLIEVRPWFVREKACALIEINCHPLVPHHFTVGNLSEMTLVLGRLESYSLSQISIRHCRALEMPPSLDRYRQLLGIKLYNVSLASWSDDAALRNALHPKMSYLFCVRTTFLNHTLPSGLTAVDYPQRLLDIEFVHTNLRFLPSDLHEKLPPLVVLYIEYGEFDHVPPTIARSRLYQLHFTGNALVTLDPAILLIPRLDYLSLGFTKLTSLPENIDATSLKLIKLRLEHTNISSLPSWIDERFLKSCKVFLAGSPLCEAIKASRVQLTPTLELIDCDDVPLCTRDGFFGVDSAYFEVLFLTREFVETGLQSYQAYQMTHQSPRLTLNRIFVALLVINCWSSSLVHLIVRDRALQRLLCILSDTILDFVATIGVPVVLAVSYLPDFDYTRLDWFYEKYYEDKWFVNYVIECPIVLLGSWFEVCARMTLSLSLLSSLNRMNKLVARRRLRAIGPVPSTLASTTPIHVQISTTLNTEQSAWGRWSQRVVTWGHRCLAVYGALVLAVHLHAEYGSSPTGCLIEVRPWFVRDKACALIEINCHPFVPHHFTVGNLSEMTLVLGRLESYSLSQISIRHCRALEMPPSLDRYRQLLGIKLYNVSLASWSDDAALRNAFHPKMSYLFCVRTTFLNHTLPSGLTAVDYPNKLLDVELIFTNVRSLPSDLDEKWPTDMVLYVEYGEFEQLPACLARLRAFQLHLTGNPLTSLDPAVLMSPGLDYLSLGFTKLTRLPDAIDPRAVKALRRFRLENTNVSALPSWMNDAFGRPPKVFMAGTPLCDSLQASSLPLTPALKLVDCAEKRPLLFPIQLEMRANEP